MAEPAKKPLRDFSNGIDPALVRAHFRDESEANEKAKAARTAIQNVRKRMKADGFNTASVKLTLDLMKIEMAEAVEILNGAYFMLKSLNAPLGSQLDFIDMVDDNAPVSEEERIARWKSDGANAFVMGSREIDCPHNATMPAGQAWMQGFREAESEAIAHRTAVEAAEENPIDDIGGKKKARGRPPGAKNKLKLAAVDGEQVQTDIEGSLHPAQVNNAPAAPVQDADLPPDLDDLPAPPIAEDDAPPAPPVA